MRRTNAWKRARCSGRLSSIVLIELQAARLPPPGHCSGKCRDCPPLQSPGPRSQQQPSSAPRLPTTAGCIHRRYRCWHMRTTALPGTFGHSNGSIVPWNVTGAKMLSSRSWQGPIWWKQFQQIKEAVSVDATKAGSPVLGSRSYRRAVKQLLTSVVREIRQLRSVGAGARATARGHPVGNQQMVVPTAIHSCPRSAPVRPSAFCCSKQEREKDRLLPFCCASRRQGPGLQAAGVL